jgi:hypothetical protein
MIDSPRSLHILVACLYSAVDFLTGWIWSFLRALVIPRSCFCSIILISGFQLPIFPAGQSVLLDGALHSPSRDCVALGSACPQRDGTDRGQPYRARISLSICRGQPMRSPDIDDFQSDGFVNACDPEKHAYRAARLIERRRFSGPGHSRI